MKCTDQWIRFQKADAPLNFKQKIRFGLQENISFTWRDSISLYPGDFDPPTLSSVWIMSLALPSVWRAVHTPYSLNEDQTPSFDFTLSSLSVSVLVFLYECFHYFRSCSGLSVAFLLCSLVLSKCYCRVFQWDESAYVYINRREYNWLYTSYTLCRVLI